MDLWQGLMTLEPRQVLGGHVEFDSVGKYDKSNGIAAL